MVVSTFCKKCGVHLSISGRQVIAKEAGHAGGTVDDATWQTPAVGAVESSTAPNPVTPSAGQPAAQISETPELIRPVTETEAEEGGFGVFLKQQHAANAQSTESTLESILQTPQSGSELTSPVAESTPTATQMMKNQDTLRNSYFKDAECFECGNKSKISRSCRSANCPACGAGISFEDLDINMRTTQAIKTRGDLIVRKRGHLSAESIRCKDLRCQGIIEANIEASGDAIFRTSGTIIGEVRCKRFIVEKGAKIVFINTIFTEDADIQANVTGNIVSNGPLVIGRKGIVNGDISFKSVSIEPGGTLNGTMTVLSSQAAPKTEV
jgi:cytoskeletal protein CcmA (bactofilin family)/ribosomal protein S27E